MEMVSLKVLWTLLNGIAERQNKEIKMHNMR